MLKTELIEWWNLVMLCTSEGVSCRGLLGRSVVTVLDLTDSSSGLSLSPVCGVQGKNWEISGGVFAALSSPGRHWFPWQIKSNCHSFCTHLLLIAQLLISCWSECTANTPCGKGYSSFHQHLTSAMHLSLNTAQVLVGKKHTWKETQEIQHNRKVQRKETPEFLQEINQVNNMDPM